MAADEPTFWTKAMKASGTLGGLAVIMVILASRLDGVFDWRVFLLAGGAVFLVWMQNWLLVPDYLRREEAENLQWRTFFESDWRLVDCVSGLNGTDWDKLKGIFHRGDDQEARGFIRARWPVFDADKEQEFIRFFQARMTDTVSAHIDETGRLRPFDDY